MQTLLAILATLFSLIVSNVGASPLVGESRVVTAGSTTDGPFVEAKEVVGGYMIVTADSMDEAVQIVRESPACWSPESSVEIGECQTP